MLLSILLLKIVALRTNIKLVYTIIVTLGITKHPSKLMTKQTTYQSNESRKEKNKCNVSSFDFMRAWKFLCCNLVTGVTAGFNCTPFTFVPSEPTKMPHFYCSLQHLNDSLHIIWCTCGYKYKNAVIFGTVVRWTNFIKFWKWQ